MTPGEAVEEYLKAGVLSGTHPKLIESLRGAYKRSGMKGFVQKWLNGEKQSEEDSFPSLQGLT
jgi:hypothetical protein